MRTSKCHPMALFEFDYFVTIRWHFSVSVQKYDLDKISMALCEYLPPALPIGKFANLKARVLLPPEVKQRAMMRRH